MEHANCSCAECAKLDALPVRRHGIPHAKQSTFLNAAYYYAPWPEKSDAELDAELDALTAQIAQREHDSLPLFAGIAPDLFA